MLSAEEIKQAERSTYDACADFYSRVWTAYTHHIADTLVRLVGAQPGDTGLDVTAGTGAAGLRLAERVGEKGKVYITDISPGMIEQARANAVSYGVRNATFQVMDAENLEFPDASIDRVISTFGIMFLPDIRRGMREAYRVLKPGGSIGLAVWSTLENVPFIGHVMQAVLTQMAPPMVRLMLKAPGGVGERVRKKLLRGNRPTGYTPGRFGEPGELEQAMEAAGFQDVQRMRGVFPLEFANVQEFLDATFKGSPAKAMLEAMPGPKGERMLAELRRLVGVPSGKVVLNNEACMVYGRKPA